MRTIKFRGWDEDRKIFVYLNLETGIINKKAIDWVLDGKGSGDRIYIKEWQQYTNLKDKNGKEIYEGDIVIGNLCQDHRGVFKEKFVVEYKKNGEWVYPLTSWEFMDKEIIGNVYENPIKRK